jgi:hypothetical protein
MGRRLPDSGWSRGGAGLVNAHITALVLPVMADFTSTHPGEIPTWSSHQAEQTL